MKEETIDEVSSERCYLPRFELLRKRQPVSAIGEDEALVSRVGEGITVLICHEVLFWASRISSKGTLSAVGPLPDGGSDCGRYQR